MCNFLYENSAPALRGGGRTGGKDMELKGGEGYRGVEKSKILHEKGPWLGGPKEGVSRRNEEGEIKRKGFKREERGIVKKEKVNRGKKRNTFPTFREGMGSKCVLERKGERTAKKREEPKGQENSFGGEKTRRLESWRFAEGEH